MNRIPIVLLGALAASGCVTEERLLQRQQLRQTYASLFNCPIEQVAAKDSRRQWRAQGCGREAVCAEPQGPCEEVFNSVQKLEIARSTFSKETGCPLIDIIVEPTNEGISVDGCGRYAVCPEPGKPCFARHRPHQATCEELARGRYDQCVAHDDSRSKDRAYGPRGWDSPAQAAGAVSSVVANAKGAGVCEKRLDADLANCRPDPAPAASP